MLKAPPGLRIDEEGVVAAVPGHVHESDELSVAVPGGHPPQAVHPDPVPPAGDGTPAVGLDEVDHLGVGQRPAPRVGDVFAHTASLSSGPFTPGCTPRLTVPGGIRVR